MTNLRTIGPQGLNPRTLLEFVLHDIDDLKELYIVGVDKEGKHRIWCTGDLSGFSMAAHVMHDMTLKYLNGLIE